MGSSSSAAARARSGKGVRRVSGKRLCRSAIWHSDPRTAACEGTNAFGTSHIEAAGGAIFAIKALVSLPNLKFYAEPALRR